jgi:hypothetical protein
MGINWASRKYSQEEFATAWNSALSIAEVSRKLNVNKTGAGYRILKLAAEDLGLNRDHMTGQAWNVAAHYRPFGKTIPLLEILVEKSTYSSSHALKNRLFKEGLKTKKCEKCKRVNWMGKPIPLTLEHCNGNHSDNRIENLQILCWNCHGQTDTFGGKNIGWETPGFIPKALRVIKKKEPKERVPRKKPRTTKPAYCYQTNS